MKLLFVHDSEKLKQDNKGNLYNSGSYNEEVWSQYTSIFDDITFIARKESEIYDKEAAESKFNFFNQEKIRFIQLQDSFSSIKEFLNVDRRKVNDSIIENEVLECDYLIARLPSSAGYRAIDYAKKYNKPYLIEVVGCVWDSLWNHSFKGKILAPLSYQRMRKKIASSNYTLYVTEFFLQQRYPSSGNKVACSDVQIKKMSKDIINRRIENIKLMNDNSKIVLGTLGAIDVKYKGHENVIKALSILKQDGITNFEYQVVGNGSNKYLSEITKKYNVVDQVKFLGSLPHERVFDWLDTIDTYVQPSKTEGLPRSVIEAMSRAVPVIGSDVGGIPELVNKEYLFNASKPEEIALLLNQVNKERLVSEAKRSYNKSKNFDKDYLNGIRKSFYQKFTTIN